MHGTVSRLFFDDFVSPILTFSRPHYLPQGLRGWGNLSLETFLRGALLRGFCCVQFKFQSISILTIRNNRRQQIVSMQ